MRIKLNIFFVTLWGSLLLSSALIGAATHLAVQDGSGTKQADTEPKLTEDQARGEGLFLQKCSVCHMQRIFKWGKPPARGPNLAGVFKNASADEEKVLKELIMKGNPDMPGFRYDIDSEQMNALIEYLKGI